MVTARAVTASGSSNIRHGMDLLDTPVLNKETAFTGRIAAKIRIKRLARIACVLAMFLAPFSLVYAQQTDTLQQQVEQLKQQYQQTTQQLQERIAALEQEIEKQREQAEKEKKATVSVAELGAQQEAKKVLGAESDQVGSKFQGQIPSQPSYDMLQEAENKITGLERQVGAFEGRFKDLMRRIPVHVITVHAALVGAAAYGLEKLNRHQGQG